MSTESIAFYLENSVGTGCFAFYYDFEHYENNFILTTGQSGYSTLTQYSGEIFGDVNEFKNTNFGSGAFNLDGGDSNYIKIENILPDDELIPPSTKGWSFLVSQEKTDNSCGSIFSNFAGEQISTSGWEFGINNANQLYFKYQDAFVNQAPGNPYMHVGTLNNIPAAKNYYAVTYSANNITLARYDPQLESWELNKFPVNANYIRNNKDWYIGKGEYPYVGYMDQFAFFNQPLSLSDLQGVIKASYQDIESGVGKETLTVSGDITGYENFPTGITGNILTSGQLSGFIEVTGSGNNLTSTPLYGDVDSGSGYFEPSGYYTGSGNLTHPESGQFYFQKIAEDDLVGAVTGFETGSEYFENVFQIPVYQGEDLTGIISSGSGIGDELRSPDEEIVIDPGITMLSGSGIMSDYSYNPSDLTYMGQRGGGSNIVGGEEGDYVEYILNIEEESNIEAGYSYSPVVRKGTFIVSNSYADSPEKIKLYMNGIYQQTGKRVFGGQDFTNPLDPLSLTENIEDGNYLLKDTSVQYSGGYFQSSDQVVYDESDESSNGKLVITDTSEYDDAPFSEINVNNSIVFFNGQKIYEGIDWEDNGGFFPIGDITNMIGTYISRDSYKTESSVGVSGINLYDIENIYGNNYIAFINGVRSPKDQFLYYSSGVSLIQPNKNLIELPYKKLYNITAYNTFF